jgi:phosphocarrier protein
MVSFEYVIKDEVGIHARPAGELVTKAKSYADHLVEVSKGEAKADAKKLFALLKLGVKKGDTVKVDVSGPNEGAISKELQEFFASHL